MTGHQIYAVVILDFVLAVISGQEESRTGVTPVAPRSEAGVVKLFNGKDMTGLYTWLRASGLKDPKRVFTIHDGMIHASGEDLWLPGH